MTSVTMESHDSRERWREMIDAAQTGEAIITRYKRPVAVLIGYDTWLAVKPEIDAYRRQQALARLGELPAP